MTRFLTKLLGKKTTSVGLDPCWHIGMMDEQAFQRIASRYVDSDPYPGFSKYLDRDQWVRNAIAHVQLAGLAHESGKSILDIGTGAGYFPFVCNNLGHRAIGIDVPGHSFYADMIDLLKVQRKEYYIRAFESLPDLGGPFDRITAFAICFNGHATCDVWGVPEWNFFVEDVVENQLSETGTVILKFNPEPDGEHYSPAVYDYFLSLGAAIKGPIVSFVCGTGSSQ